MDLSGGEALGNAENLTFSTKLYEGLVKQILRAPEEAKDTSIDTYKDHQNTKFFYIFFRPPDPA